MIKCEEETVLESTKNALEEENMQTQYSVLGYKMDLFFHEYKLATEDDKLGYNDRNIDCEIEKLKAVVKKLGCSFLRINPDEENFNIFKAITELYRHIKKLTKKPLIDKISKRLFELEIQSNHAIIAKALKSVVKKVLPSSL